MSETIIKTKNLCKSYGSEGQQIHVLRNISLEIWEGQFTVIMGASGSGKSTLLYMLSGMDTVTSGSVNVCGEEIQDQKEKEVARFRQETAGFIFQQMNLLSHMTCFENICTAGYLIKGKKRREVHAEARELLKLVGIEELSQRLPTQLSGGQQQRCAIARSLINQPRILFADEPTGALNSSAGKEVLDLLYVMSRSGQNILMVTHDLKAALRADRILYLKDGKIEGELKMPPFTEKEASVREKQLIGWLSGMGW